MNIGVIHSLKRCWGLTPLDVQDSRLWMCKLMTLIGIPIDLADKQAVGGAACSLLHLFTQQWLTVSRSILQLSVGPTFVKTPTFTLLGTRELLDARFSGSVLYPLAWLILPTRLKYAFATLQNSRSSISLIHWLYRVFGTLLLLRPRLKCGRKIRRKLRSRDTDQFNKHNTYTPCFRLLFIHDILSCSSKATINESMNTTDTIVQCDVRYGDLVFILFY